jgi:hypothetical protein
MARDPRIALDDMVVALDYIRAHSPRGKSFLGYLASLDNNHESP